MVGVVSAVAGKLADLLAQEVGFLRGVDDELRSLLRLFQSIQAYLNGIGPFNQNDQRHNVWVKQIQEVAYDAEDIIDDYIFKIHQQYRPSPCSCLSCLRACVVLPSKLVILHDLGNKIRKVKGIVQEIYDNRNKFGNENIGASSSNSTNDARPPLMSRRRTPDVEEEKVLGFDQHFQALARMLMEDDGSQRRTIISIIGMGGLGKTTLAKKIFDDPGVRRHFTCQAWIWVSQENGAQQVLETIAKDAMAISEERLKRLYYEELERMVYEYLKRTKYLVVLDDLWSKEAWDSIKKVLPDMMNGSRVLLTTRKKDVALHADRQNLPYELEFLSEEHSWELFCRKAILTKRSKDCPAHLESIGREMVAKCCGLPLAIVVLGSLVSYKRPSVEEWRKLLKSANWQLRQGENQISEVLALSYHHLPYFIKPCFLYFGIFRRGALISAKRLIRLWIAEGFIQPRDQETMEEVGEDYLDELVNWSMIQVVERHHHGGIKICQIHELLHDLSISLAQGMNFIHVPNNDNEQNILHEPRRLVLHHDDKSVSCIARLKSTNFTSSLRTITVMDREKRTSEMEKFFHNMKLLRVINFQGAGIKSLPDDIGKLIHLRYLGLRYTDLTELPSSIGELTNLQTFDFKNSVRIVELPSQLWKMQRNLRHLEGTGFSIKGLPSTESLPNLQTLTNVKAGIWLQDGLQKMRNLRKLGVHDVTGSYKEALLDCLSELDNLTKLAWTSLPRKTGDDCIIPSSVLSNSQHRNNLQVIYLHGPFEGLPDVNCMPASLSKLTLQFTGLQEDPLAMLGKLDNLQVLRLRRNAFVGREMVCLEKGFPQLKVLELSELLQWKEWRIEDEAMPKLRELIIETCGLVMLPRGLQKVSTLQELKVIDMRNYFCERLSDNDGEDWETVKHISSVRVLPEKPALWEVQGGVSFRSGLPK